MKYLSQFKKSNKSMEGATMKTLKLFCGFFVAMQLVGGFVYAQDENKIPTAGQLITNRSAAVSTDTKDKDDLYGVLRGSVGSLLPEGIRGPRKTRTSPSVVIKKTAPVNQPSETDLYVATILKVKETAVKDLASRLRVDENQIRLISVTLSPEANNIYTVTLERPIGDIHPLAAGVQGQVTPQPFGRYTYRIRVSEIAVPEVPLIQILELGYFDGSKDMYIYNNVNGKIKAITQIDAAGRDKGLVLYVKWPRKIMEPRPGAILRPDFQNRIIGDDSVEVFDRIQAVLVYDTDAETFAPGPVVKYTDVYRYDQLGFRVNRYSGDISDIWYTGSEEQINARYVCTYSYEGTPGLERLIKCTFNDGTYVTYSNDLAQAVYTSASSEPIMTFMYHYDQQAGGIVETLVRYADGREVIYKGLADPVNIVIEYRNGELIRKANEKILGHQNNIKDVRDKADVCGQKDQAFNQLYAQYLDLFGQLPEGSPFQFIDPIWILLYVPVTEAIQNSEGEIAVLQKAIAENDTKTIIEHLGVIVEEVSQALRGLGDIIEGLDRWSSIIEEQVTAIREYVDQHNEMIKKATELAVNDLASRLRVGQADIIVESITVPDFGASNIFTVTLNRRLPIEIYGTTATTGQVTPQPYGRCTYTIQYNQLHTPDMPDFQILRVDYFPQNPGLRSYDLYKYASDGTSTTLCGIDQYDGNGRLKAKIRYDRVYQYADGTNRAFIKDVTYYKPDGSIERTDLYTYRSDNTLVSVTHTNPFTNRVFATTTYTGAGGQERIFRTTFTDGTYITYNNDLAQNTYDPNGVRIMSFEYHYDAQAGGIVETLVNVYDSTGKAIETRLYKGLADPIRVMTGKEIWMPYEPPHILAADAQDPQTATAQNPTPAVSNPPQANPPTNEPMPGWLQTLLNELLSKNAATSKGGGSKNVHTYDQMAADNNEGLGLRWKK